MPHTVPPISIDKSASDQSASKHANSHAIHLGYLDGLRALAALFVVLHHAWLTVWPVDYNRLPNGRTLWLTSWLLYGHFAVDVFIVLSGFCLMLPVVRGNWTLRGGAIKFFVRRARRILPPYYFALIFSLLLALTLIGHKTGSHWDCCLPVTKKGFLIDLLMLQDVMGTTINHAFWSISVEWRIYFLFPLLVLGWRCWGGVITTVLAVGISVVAPGLVKHFAPSHAHWLGECPWYLGLFALGMLGAAIAYARERIWSRLRSRLPWGGAFIGTAGLIVAVCHFWGWQKIFAHFRTIDLVVALSCVCLLITIARVETSILRRIFAWRPFVFIGTFAYSLYLIHAPLLQVIWQYGLRPFHLSALTTFLLLIFVGTPLIVGASFLFFLVCERPFLNMRRHETQAQTSRDAVLSPAP